MILHLAVLLLFQLLGEVLTRAFGLILPGPVLGLVLLLAFFMIFPRAADAIRPSAQGLLSHLSLLFVPAGVGVVGHLDKLGSDGLGLLVALVVSTVTALAVGALTFSAVARLTGDRT